MKGAVLLVLVLCSQSLSIRESSLRSHEGSVFQFHKITKFKKIWTDRGSGGDTDFSIWKPNSTDPNVNILSYYGKQGYD